MSSCLSVYFPIGGGGPLVRARLSKFDCKIVLLQKYPSKELISFSPNLEQSHSVQKQAHMLVSFAEINPNTSLQDNNLIMTLLHSSEFPREVIRFHALSIG